MDLGHRTIRADGKIVNELKIKKQADSVLKFLNGTNASVVMVPLNGTNTYTIF